jgi:hypothetical protein
VFTVFGTEALRLVMQADLAHLASELPSLLQKELERLAILPPASRRAAVRALCSALEVGNLGVQLLAHPPGDFDLEQVARELHLELETNPKHEAFAGGRAAVLLMALFHVVNEHGSPSKAAELADWADRESQAMAQSLVALEPNHAMPWYVRPSSGEERFEAFALWNEEQLRGNDAIIARMEGWKRASPEETQEQERIWPLVKEGLDRHRLSDRKLFP